jgi:hypothetical protein
MPTTVGPNNSRMSKTNSMDAKLRSYAGQNRDASNNRGPNIDGITRNRRTAGPQQKKNTNNSRNAKNNMDASNRRDANNDEKQQRGCQQQ